MAMLAFMIMLSGPSGQGKDFHINVTYHVSFDLVICVILAILESVLR